MHFSIVVLVAGCLGATHAANILGIVPVPSKSHSILFQRLMLSLAEKGHNVTFVNTFKMNKKYPNVTEITLPMTSEDMMKEMKMDLFNMRHQSIIQMLMAMPFFGIMISEKQISSQQFQDLIKSDSSFDLILAENFMTESINAALSEKFKAPTIGFQTIQPNLWVNYLTGNIAPTSYIPDPMLGFPQRMTFLQRLTNLVYQTLSELNHYYIYLPKQDAIYRKYVGNDATPMMDHIYNTSLIFINDHYSLTYPRPLVPNVIPIGGVHVPPVKKLPKDLQTYLDNSKNGVILFSMGSNLKSSQMPKKTIDMFLNVFSKLKQNVLWKFEADLEGKPSNLMISNWLPQSDILGHPNVKLFITHGGLLSTTEAVERGVPIIGIPIFGDQPMNMKHSVNAGVGLSLEYDDLTEESLFTAIKEVIENPKYTQASQLRSSMLKEQPTSQIDTAIFWVEYVIKHKGARHLRSIFLDLHWYEAYQVDVLAVLLVATIIFFKLTICCTRFVFLRICGRKSDKASKIKKNN